MDCNPPSYHQINVNGVDVDTTVADSSWMITCFLNDLRISSFVRSKTSVIRPAVVGIDVEWKPLNYSSFNDVDRVATLSLCHGNSCLIIQLRHIDSIPQSLKSFLTDPSINFVGVGITEDLCKLGCDYGLERESGFFELASLAARVYGKKHFDRSGLFELARDVVGLAMDEPGSIINSDWSTSSLTMEQIKHTTINARVSLAIGNKLLGGGNQ